jgi:NADH:ubiquinone oxidoreductase subunit 6 (subunit J)
VTALDLAFLAASVIAVAGGVLAITTRQVVHAALWLVVSLLGVAGAVLILGAELVALVLLLVYVGAVVVLVLFALMLTRAPIGPDTAHAPGLPRALAAGAVGAAVVTMLLSVLIPLAGGWGATVDRQSADSPRVAREIFTTWVWPFELLSLLLLAALIAALAVSRIQRDAP